MDQKEKEEVKQILKGYLYKEEERNRQQLETPLQSKWAYHNHPHECD